MPIRLSTADADFEARFVALLGAKREASQEVGDAVAAILADVRTRGDAAVIDYTARFDRLTLTPQTLRFSETEIDAGVAAVPAKVRAALETAHDRIRAHHEQSCRIARACGPERDPVLGQVEIEEIDVHRTDRCLSYERAGHPGRSEAESRDPCLNLLERRSGMDPESSPG